MTTPDFDPITYDYSSLLAGQSEPESTRQTGLVPADLKWLAPRLEDVRRQMLEELDLFQKGGPVPAELQPLDAGFFDLPEQFLGPRRRDLEAIQQTADRLAAECDRVVVLGIGGSYMGARALMEACCHPYFNELPRKRRGGRPRMYFEGNNVDNDALQGLLDLVEGTDDWAIVVISKSGGTLETAVAFRLLINALRRSCGNDREKLRRRIVPVTGRSGRLRELAQALGCPAVFPIPDGVGGRYSVLTAVGLLPAALLGLDVEHLLEGAAAMNERFRTAPPLCSSERKGAGSERSEVPVPFLSSNPPLDYAGVGRLMEVRRGAVTRVLSTWGKGLEALGLWYDQLLSESLGKNGQGATPITVVNTRDLHSRGQQHQEGRRDKLITNVFVEKPNRDLLAVPQSELDQDRLNELAGKTVPEILHAAFTGTNRAYADDYRRTATISLPRLDEASLGQLLQMLMLATVAEGRLIGVNPFGQPGVEAYKRNMNAILRPKK
ncbi:MAG: glucose-6-phosphate isomerase [Pirellulales bacterium]|nr:glucose-6-phosphate isomerase [Pirellulales bacterium]